MTDCKNLDLARQWAEHVQYGKALGDVQAAADLISSLPDEWVDADTLRKYIADWREGLATSPRGNYEEEMLNDLEALLPAPPAPRTLADMGPEERAECQWMQAEHEEHGRGIITHIFDKSALMLFSDGRYADPCYIGEIVPLPDLPRMEWPGSEPGNVQVNRMDGLARTGETSPAETADNRRSSTARTHPESAASESASPRPEDVPVGEPWQVEVDGQAAIGYRIDPEARLCWAVVYRDDFGHAWLYDRDVTLIARLVPETTDKPETDQEFDPAYVYTDRDGDEWEYIEGRWIIGTTHANRVAAAREDSPGIDSLLAEFGPYTRIEDNK